MVPVAERAVETGKVRHEVVERFELAMVLKVHTGEGIAAARQYLDAMLGLEVWSHGLFACAAAGRTTNTARRTSMATPWRTGP